LLASSTCAARPRVRRISSVWAGPTSRNRCRNLVWMAIPPRSRSSAWDTAVTSCARSTWIMPWRISPSATGASSAPAPGCPGQGAQDVLTFVSCVVLIMLYDILSIFWHPLSLGRLSHNGAAAGAAARAAAAAAGCTRCAGCAARAGRARGRHDLRGGAVQVDSNKTRVESMPGFSAYT